MHAGSVLIDPFVSRCHTSCYLMWHAEGRSLLACCHMYAAWPKTSSYPTLWLVPNEAHMRAAGTNNARG